MLGGLVVLIVTGFFAFGIINAFTKPGTADNRTLRELFLYHVAISFIYYLYILSNPSDSRGYYFSATKTDSWTSLYGTSTTFIKFLSYPFVKYMAFSYEATMALFSFFGFIGFIFFYLVFRERILFKHSFMGMDLLRLIFFLPNLHFWSGSLGKGSVIFLGIALFFYGISEFKKRIIFILIGGVIIYHVRPHIMLVMLVSFAIAFVFTSRGIGLGWRLLFLGGATLAFFYIYQDVLTLVGVDEEEFISQGLDLTHRATELSKATSGVDITNYSLPLQLFTFLFRPLFFDAPGVLGLIVSVENVFYLMITFRLLSHISGWRHMFFGGFLPKGALLSFLSVSIALAQVSGNLGLAIRQKSQVMILFLFVVLAFLDDEKRKVIRTRRQPPLGKRRRVPSDLRTISAEKS